MIEKENIDDTKQEEDKKENEENKENEEIKENNINQIIINDFIGAQDDENNEKKIHINMNIPEENKIEIKKEENEIKQEKKEIKLEEKEKNNQEENKNEIIIESKKDENENNINININLENNNNPPDELHSKKFEIHNDEDKYLVQLDEDKELENLINEHNNNSSDEDEEEEETFPFRIIGDVQKKGESIGKYNHRYLEIDSVKGILKRY